MQTILVDTDVAIDYLRGLAYAKELLASLWSEDRACISALSVFELEAGMKTHERKATMAFIDACRVDAVTRKIAEKAGDLRREYQKRGITIPSMDCIIAATALANGYKLATRNKRHFPESILVSLEKYEQLNRDDSCWIEKTENATQEGFIGTDETAKYIKARMKRKKTQ